MRAHARLRSMIEKEVRQFLRNRVMLRMAIAMPIVQTFLLSWAVNTDIVHVPLTVCDEDGSQRSRELVQRIGSLPTFRVVSRQLRSEDVVRELDAGRAELGLHIPPGFSRDVNREGASVQLLVNGADSTTATAAAAYLMRAMVRYDASVKAEVAARRGPGARLPRLSAETRVFYNPDLRSVWFMAPGIMAMILGVLMLNMSSLSIAREREVGTLEQLVMTPIRPWELIAGKLIPYGVVGVLDGALVAVLVVFVLGVPFRGSVLALVVATPFFLIATLGLGLLVSAAAANQQQAQLMNFFLAFPSMLLSGFIFPLENLPTALAWVSHAVPMTYFLQVIRGSFLRGSGLDVLFVPYIVPLMALAAIFFTLGAVRFHKRLD